MDLTEEGKNDIDAMSYEDLLRTWRFAPAGDPRFNGESGQYWGKRLAELRKKEPDNGVGASKRIGWDGP